ncbi:hypothetical protein PTSG_03074 [Salpingoeca rosetta]|uniref:Uncharacterized protein n=1 Tax=Salpingoeca rosetta (strain ATCC 50818 / BSB-021) TaxID=946362 RepID=F2U463_SALR5|nr:uncharacterized protein PTSG_03074 [Salpingoeca rosetta]EGD82429.1 hypothetical protein PTSG_03074 [Salpingoeca rosetta]|eukprot:XP_004995665.1 hypothetical protein PTSG_03074 [Salpingoeca rosetta]
MQSVFMEAPASFKTRLVFGIMLSALLFLHCYWYTLFFVMLGKYLSKGQVKDISETDADNRKYNAATSKTTHRRAKKAN